MPAPASRCSRALQDRSGRLRRRRLPCGRNLCARIAQCFPPLVVVENIARYVRKGYGRMEAAVAATDQIYLAVLGCTATLVLAFLPLLFLPEGAGEFIRSLPAAILFTVLASLFVALTIIPFLASRMLRDNSARASAPTGALSRVIARFDVLADKLLLR